MTSSFFNSLLYYLLLLYIIMWGNESRQSLLYMVGLPSYICRATENFSLSKANKMNIYIYIYIYLTNRFQVAMRLFSNRSQRTSKCGKNISDALGCALCATFLFLPHFDVICGLGTEFFLITCLLC